MRLPSFFLPSICHFLFYLVLIFPFTTQAADKDMPDITIVGNSLPPFSYQEKGRINGFSVTVLKTILKQHYGDNVWVDRKPVPFARAYSELQTNLNTIGVNIVKNQRRASKFHWVGPYYTINMAVLGRADNTQAYPTVNSFDDKRIAVVRDTLIIDVLLQKGFFEPNLVVVSDPITAYRMLKAGRIEFIAHIPPVFSDLVRRSTGSEPIILEEKLQLQEGDFYFAFSADFLPQDIAALQTKLDALLQSESIAAIYEKYGLKSQSNIAVN